MSRTSVHLRKPCTNPLSVFEELVCAVEDTLLLRRQTRILANIWRRWASIDEWRRRTSFDDNALLVKSLQHALKQRSTRFEYIRMKSCIWRGEGEDASISWHAAQRRRRWHLLPLNDPSHVGLLGRVHLREVHGEEVVRGARWRSVSESERTLTAGRRLFSRGFRVEDERGHVLGDTRASYASLLLTSFMTLPLPASTPEGNLLWELESASGSNSLLLLYVALLQANLGDGK